MEWRYCNHKGVLMNKIVGWHLFLLLISPIAIWKLNNFKKNSTTGKQFNRKSHNKIYSGDQDGLAEDTIS